MAAEVKRPERGVIRRWGPPIIAFSLLGWVIQHHGGVDLITQLFQRLGWWWLLIFIPSGLRVALIISAYRNALPGRGREVSFWTLTQIERSGAALNSLLPFGKNSSQLVKVPVLRHWYPTEGIVAAWAWGVMAKWVSNVWGGVGTAIPLLMGFGERAPMVVLTLVGIGMAAPSLFIAYSLRRGLAKKITGLLTLFPAAIVRRRREKALVWANKLDTHMHSAIGERRGDFLRVLWLRFLSQLVRIGEIWLVVELLEIPGGILTALIYNGVSRAVTQLGGVIPGRVGLMEWIQAGTFGAIGLTEQAGVEIALTFRVRYLVMLFVNYTALARLDALIQRYPPRHDVEDTADAAAVSESVQSGVPDPDSE